MINRGLPARNFNSGVETFDLSSRSDELPLRRTSKINANMVVIVKNVKFQQSWGQHV